MSAGKTTARDALLRLTNPRLMWLDSKRTKRPIERIVILRPDHLGDLLFATPALKLMRQAYPDAYITGLVGPWGRAMWQGNPHLDDVVVVRFPGIGPKQGGLLAPYFQLRQEARKLEQGGYDLGITLRFDHWWGAALLAAARIPHRWGYGTPGMSEWLTNAVPYTAGKHEVEQNLTLTKAVLKGMGVEYAPPAEISRRKGLPPLLPPLEEQPATDVTAGWIGAPRRAIIHPGTMAANKLWTIGGWAEVAVRLAGAGWRVGITGTAEEKPLADAIEAKAQTLEVKVVNLAGKTQNLAQLIWLLRRAQLVLGVDNGPLHLASAVGVPNVRLYGPSDEKNWGPWGDPKKNRLIRAPGTIPSQHLEVGSQALEGGPEMKAITVDMVMREVDNMTANHP